MLSRRASTFTESVIREMTRLNLALHGPERAINFAQGFPDFDAPQELIEAAQEALQDGYNQYALTWGAPQLRRAIATKYARPQGREIDPESEITVVCGATESMIAAMLAILNPGDEVVIFEPHYENYGPDCILSGATPHFVPLHPPGWDLDEAELRAAFNNKTRAIVVNTPHNPTGKVMSRKELSLIAELCQEHDAFAITDEIYEHMVYAGEHISLASLPGMSERTITISGASKTYSVTGWRVGWLIAPPALSAGIRKVHDFLTVGAAHPLQVAVAQALAFPDSYYDALLEEYRGRRDAIVSGLRQTGFEPLSPDGAYYVMAGIEKLGWHDDVAFARHLIETAAVATVPASSFYSDDPTRGRGQVRFSFPKKLETIERGIAALRGIGPGPA
jgi:aminotransferase